MLPQIVWLATAAVLLSYLALAMIRRNVAVRMSRIAGFAAAGLLGQALLVLGGGRIEFWQWCAIAAAVLLLIGGCLFRRWWLLSVPYDDLAARVHEACRQLLLEVSESPSGCFQLTHRQLFRNLRLGKLGPRYSWAVVPSAPTKTKIFLLTSWLRKQFPGPVPRIRIYFKRE